MPNIIFLHPDLGIGGAERLVVDAAVALQQKGHSVKILTAHHDTTHCFEETRNGVLDVEVYGDWLPRNIFGYGHALCAYLRMVFLSICLLWDKTIKTDVIIIDQVSIPIPILKWKSPNIIFYCHFPDQLLAKPGSALKKLYRGPLNWLEEYTTNQAKTIFVNSKYTAGVFMDTFKSASRRPDVLYPSLVTTTFDKLESEAPREILPGLEGYETVFLSLNRYETKKNIPLALLSFAKLRSLLSTDDWSKCHLVIAGGYDDLLPENEEVYCRLKQLVQEEGLINQVTMLKSPDDVVKAALLKNAT